MRKEIIITDNIKLVMTKNEFGYSEVLETFKHSKFIWIVTYNISKESSDLLGELKKLSSDVSVTLITNIPSRFKSYHYVWARERAKKNIERYIERLDPYKYDANLKTFFNFDNHSKIIMTDQIAYIGSANASDESKSNFECGVIIKDSEIINKINDVFINAQLEDSHSYYKGNSSSLIVILISFLKQLEFYSEEFYWSFYCETDHAHRGRGDEYRVYDADLSPILVEDLYGFVNEVNDCLASIGEEFDLRHLNVNIFSELKQYFETDSGLEIFSRFDYQRCSEELFEEYYIDGYQDNMDLYNQIAADNAGEIAKELCEDIKDTVLECQKKLDLGGTLLRDLISMLKEELDINPVIDNTNT